MPTRRKETDPLEKFREVFSQLDAPKGGLPTMPTKIADLSLDELGNITSRYAAWREFTEDRHMEACAVYAQCKMEADAQMDKLLLQSNAPTVTERKAEAKSSPQMDSLNKRLNDAEIYMTLFANKLESFNNVLATLSRELTRRGVGNS